MNNIMKYIDPIPKFVKLIKNKIHYYNQRYIIILILSSAIGFLFILLSTSKYGIGISPDSIQYISCSESLVNGNGFFKFDGSVFVEYAPLLPIILSIFRILGLNLEISMTIFNASIFSFLIFFTGICFIKYVRNKFILFSGILLILFSFPLHFVTSYLWTEPLFILFTMFSIYYLHKCLIENSQSDVICLIIFTSLACLTRYIGIVLIITGIILILLYKKNLSLKYRFIFSILFGFFSSIPTGIFILRNFFLTKTLIGYRPSSIYSLTDNIYFMSRSITNWYFPISFFSQFEMVVILLFLMIFIALICYYLLPEKKGNNQKLFTVSFLYFFNIYLIFIILSATKVGFDILSHRLLSPISIPIIIIFICIIDFILIENRPSNKSFLKIQVLFKNIKVKKLIIILFSILVLSSSIITTTSIYNKITNGVVGYNVPEWENSSLIKALEENTLDGIIYSNSAEALYYFTGIDNIKFSPRKRYQASYELTNDLKSFNKSLEQTNNNYLIWFNMKERDYLYSLEELKSMYNISSYIKTSDGTIFLIQKKNYLKV